MKLLCLNVALHSTVVASHTVFPLFNTLHVLTPSLVLTLGGVGVLNVLDADLQFDAFG